MIKFNKINLPFKFKITLITFFSFILLFNLWRMIFLYFYLDNFTGDVFLYLKSFYIAYRLDAVVSSILTLPVFFTSCIPKIKFNKYIKYIYYTYIWLLYIIIGFLSVIDIEFFREIGFHLNLQAQMYGFDAGAEVWTQVWVAYPVFLYLFIIIFISFMFYKIIKILIDKPILKNHSKLINFLYPIILFLFLGISARGGLQERPVTPGHAYFSNKDMMANHLAVNSVHNYIHSIMQSLNEPDLLFYSNSDQTTRDILDNNRLNNDQNKTNQKELPNIILIILESHTASRCNFLNPDLKESITPVLDDIAHNSINFRNCYANGTRSAYGLSSIYCSWPVIPGYPLNRQQQYKIKGQTTFGSIFKELGYQTAFMYGGDSEFDEMKNFVRINAFDRVYDHAEDSYLSKFSLDNKNEGVNPWGVFDEFLLNRCIEVMNEKNTESPIMISLFTTTNHLPWIVPEKYNQSISPEIPHYASNNNEPFVLSKRTMKYVDIALNQFLKKAEQQDWFDNTIFVITADHGLNIFKDHINDPKNGHIPFLIYNSHLEPSNIDKVVSQIDILPTILDLIGEYNNYDENLFGCSGFQGNKGFVFRNNDYNIQWIEDGWVYSENIGLDFMETYPINLFNQDSKNFFNIENVQKKCRSYVQSAFYQQKNKLKKGKELWK